MSISEWVEGWGYSHIYYPGHSLILGSAEGVHCINAVDLKHGGSTLGMLSTTISMWVAHAIGNYEKKVQIRTAGHTYFNGGNVGIGTDSSTMKLDVNGDAKINALHLRSTNPGASWLNSNIYYPGHSLVIGSPEGNYSHNNLDLKPGGSPLGMISSGITMWIAHSVGNHEKKVQIRTAGSTYFMGGNVGIGTNNPQKLLDVKGTIHAQNIEVDLNNWSDFVFNKDYKLPTLQEVEDHINEYKHLPDIPSEKQVKEEGINIGEMQVKLLQKIEELTLYVINQDKEIQKLKEALSER